MNTRPSPSNRENRRIALACGGLVVAMVGLAYAAVPFYDLFCRVTGFDGTPLVSAIPSEKVLDRTISVRFDANVAPGLDWRFSSENPVIEVRLGEVKTIYYKVRNTGSKATTGIATYNVQPDMAGSFFVKLQCFCFTEQTMQPGEEREEAVVFYVDPDLIKDRDIHDLESITLSYTYFPSRNGSPVTKATETPPKSDI